MSKRCFAASTGLLAAIAALGLAGPARAAELGFSGNLALQLATLAPVLFPGNPGTQTINVNGTGAGGHINSMVVPGSVFAINAFILPVTDPGVFPIAGVQQTGQNAVGNFAESGGVLGGTMSIDGVSKVCLYGACGTSANISNLTVPLDVVGLGGTTQVVGAVNLTVLGAPWTSGTVAIGTITAMGGVSPLSDTGAPSGVVTLVSPVFISTNIGAFSVVPAFAFLNLHLAPAPEPGALAAYGSAIATLIALGFSRRKKS